MRIGVSGARGKLGKAIMAELQGRAGGHEWVAISRSPETWSSAVAARKGDFDQPETLAAAYEGLDRVALIPSADLRPGVRGAQLQTAIDAAVAASVGHIFLISAAGTREAAAPSIFETYWTAEQRLIKTAPRWTILRMNYYAEAMADEIMMAQDRGVLAGLGKERVAYVSRDDLAAAAAGALVTDGHAGAIYNMTGPEALTGPDVAAIASEALGKSLSHIVLDEWQLRGGLAQAGLPEPVVQAIVQLKKGFVQGFFDIVTTDIERLSGRAPKTFRDVLATSRS